MNLKEILSISGKPGLFKTIGQTKNAVIVESFIDKKRFPVFATDKVSTLEDISVFTKDKDILLKEVLKKIYDKESGGAAIDSKSDEKKLKEYFIEILPDYDTERVHNSDIKKIISWYNLLHEHGVLNFDEVKEGEDETKVVEEPKAEEKQAENSEEPVL